MQIQYKYNANAVQTQCKNTTKEGSKAGDRRPGESVQGPTTHPSAIPGLVYIFGSQAVSSNTPAA